MYKPISFVKYSYTHSSFSLKTNTALNVDWIYLTLSTCEWPSQGQWSHDIPASSNSLYNKELSSIYYCEQVVQHITQLPSNNRALKTNDNEQTLVLKTDPWYVFSGHLCQLHRKSLHLFSKYGMCEKQKFGSNSFLKIEPSKTLTAVQTIFQQKLHAIWHSNKSKLM